LVGIKGERELLLPGRSPQPPQPFALGRSQRRAPSAHSTLTAKSSQKLIGRLHPPPGRCCLMDGGISGLGLALGLLAPAPGRSAKRLERLPPPPTFRPEPLQGAPPPICTPAFPLRWESCPAAPSSNLQRVLSPLAEVGVRGRMAGEVIWPQSGQPVRPGGCRSRGIFPAQAWMLSCRRACFQGPSARPPRPVERARDAGPVAGCKFARVAVALAALQVGGGFVISAVPASAKARRSSFFASAFQRLSCGLRARSSKVPQAWGIQAVKRFCAAPPQGPSLLGWRLSASSSSALPNNLLEEIQVAALLQAGNGRALASMRCFQHRSPASIRFADLLLLQWPASNNPRETQGITDVLLGLVVLAGSAPAGSSFGINPFSPRCATGLSM